MKNRQYYTIAAGKVKRQKAYETPLWYHHEIGGIIAALRLLYREKRKKATKPIGKFDFFCGASIGEAKRYFYTKWLSESPFEALNMEYEYHTEESVRKHPTITIVFAIQRKE